MTTYRNPTHAFIASLEHLILNGTVRQSRGGVNVSEVLNHVMTIERPLERCIVTPHRNGNIFAALAETMWALGGRNDMAFLERYLPRCRDFSDDGVVWRAGYGPRLRDYMGVGDRDMPRRWKYKVPAETQYSRPKCLGGMYYPRTDLCTTDMGGRGTGEPSGENIEWIDKPVDQLIECALLLIRDPSTRRATMSIFDPARDYGESKDIPCNNWLQWNIRDGKLHLTVAIRSNDAIWGWSGINQFEWSVLHQFMAHWTNSEVGTVTHIAASYHIYERHFERAARMVKDQRDRTLYDYGYVTPKFTTGLFDFDDDMRQFFDIEQDMRIPGRHHLLNDQIAKVKDDFIRAALQMLRSYNHFLDGADNETIVQLIRRMPKCDLRMAAIEWFTRQSFPQERLAFGAGDFDIGEEEFMADYLMPPVAVTISDVYATLRILHDKKSRAYGDSWRRAGEINGIFANITRKYDRWQNIIAGAKDSTDETLFNTVADLCVYAAKYVTWLVEYHPGSFLNFARSHGHPLTMELLPMFAGEGGFNDVTNLIVFVDGSGEWDSNATACYLHIKEMLTDRVEAVSSSRDGIEKIHDAFFLSMYCAKGLVEMANKDRAVWQRFVANVHAM